MLLHDLSFVWQIAAAILLAVVILLAGITAIDFVVLWREHRRAQRKERHP